MNDKPETTNHECEDCGVVNETVYDITAMAPYPVPSEWLCDNCAEIRWDKYQEKLMEET